MRAIAANVRRRSRACRGFRASARGLDGPSGPPSGRSRACHASRADFGGTRPRTGLDGHGGPPALTGRTRARPTRFREPPRPPSAARLPRDALSGSRGLGLGGGPDPPLAAGLGPRPSRRPRLPATSTARRRMPFPPAARLQARARISVSDLPGAARAKPPVAPVPPIDGRRAYMRAGGKPNFGTAAGRARMPGRLRKNCL